MFTLNIWTTKIDILNIIEPILNCVLLSKKNYNPNLLKTKILEEIYHKYFLWNTIFTDGSKSKAGIGAAYYDSIRKYGKCFKVDGTICIMSVELVAILEALKYILNNLVDTKVVIFTDSKSAIQHIAGCASGDQSTSLAYSILRKIVECQQKKIVLKIQWIPSHIGLHGNEEADRLARTAASDGSIVCVKPIYSEILSKYKAKTHNIFKEYFDERSLEKGIWYKTIQCQPPRIPWFTKQKMKRAFVVTALRLRSGHMPLNKFAHLMKKTDSPNCVVCNQIEDVQHILMECVQYRQNRLDLVARLGLNVLNIGLFHQILSEPTSQSAEDLLEFVINSIKLRASNNNYTPSNN
ncbi:hypothetical protein ABMA27_001708 [Loxostege sticticalis]|uniref:ribonuclease H n=1 Tax=Loxostege sticticalis TaxID=481309 RepID=A0ABR3HZG8_LOXSC